GEPPPGLDGDLRAIFDDLVPPANDGAAKEMVPAAGLMRRLERTLMADIYRWTGHFPERTRILMRYLAKRADELKQAYPKNREFDAIAALTIYITSLAMNYVHRGAYFPEPATAESKQQQTVLAADK